MNEINLGTLKMPINAATKTFALLAKRGAGKTYTGAVMAEELYKNNIPFVVFDPSELNHIKGCVVVVIDDSNASGKGFYKANIKVHQTKEHLLSSLEELSKIIGQLNGEGLFTEINMEKRTLYLS